MKHDLVSFVGMKKWVLGMGLIPIPKTQIQNSDLVGFISRPIPMKPRFGGFRGYEKMGTQLHPKTTVVRGVLAEEASELMKRFFAGKRK